MPVAKPPALYVRVEELPLPATLPVPPSALPHRLHGLGAVVLAGDIAGLGQGDAAPPPPLLRAAAICWPTTFMNSRPLAMLAVPKPEYCWPLMALERRLPLREG